MTPDEIGRLGRTLEKIDAKVDDLIVRSAKIEQRFEDLADPGDGVSCHIHDGKIKTLENTVQKVSDQQDKQNLTAIVLSACTAVVLMLGKWLIGE